MLAVVSNAPHRIFLPWDRPLLPQAVEWLAGDWSGPAALDLSDMLVIVPTRQSGRRLREALAAYAAKRGAAVFPPRVFTPEGLLATTRAPSDPSRLARTLAWIEVLRGIDLNEYRDVFPVDPPTRNFRWALGLAHRLVRVQAMLAENGLAMREVADRAGDGFVEAGRWRQLGALEDLSERRLREAGLVADDDAASRPWSFSPSIVWHGTADKSGRAESRLPMRVVLLGTPDPVPAVVDMLAAAAEPSVDVVVFAPQELAGSFDAWGRPIVAEWTKRSFEWPDFAETVHVCADPEEQARRIVSIARSYRDETAGLDGVELGIADAEVANLIETAAVAAGLTAYSPEGRRHSAGALHALLRALSFGPGGPTFDEVETLARCPEFLEFLGQRGDATFSAARFLADLDTLKRDHLPATLAEARRHASAELAPALSAIGDLAARLGQMEWPENYASVLSELFAARTLNPAEPIDAELAEAANVWSAVSRELGELRKAFPELRGEEARDLALEILAESSFSLEKPAGALEIQGWLELAYADAAHIVVGGANEGILPESVSEDAFLPDGLRRILGLRTNDSRFARDAYLLESIVRSRGTGGRIDVFLGKTSVAGDPLRPSRLLLRCVDEALPERVRFLFRALDRRESQLAWTRAWQLEPRRVPPPTKVAVTALRRWLACRFRFYLKYALRMEAIDAAKSEMDAFDFGRLCHTALEAMGRDPVLRDSTDAEVIREFLLGQLTLAITKKFGRELTLPLVIQLESARQRLAKFAEIQARERAEGWVIEQVEKPITVTIAGIAVRGQVDRIDRHRTTGAVRVLDYKTSDSGVVPRVAHTRAWREEEGLPEWARVEVDGRIRAWADLQLPLYREALAPEFGSAVSLGYITLPKAVGETAVALWDDYTPAWHLSAMACAQGVCAAIARGEFWPPNEDIRADNDEFASLFHDGVGASVAWEAIELRAER